MSSALNAAVLLFDQVEVLDFAGPYEVFTVAGIDVFTVAETERTITTVGGLNVVPHHTLATAPPAHILVVPGGRGTRRELGNQQLITWLKERTGTSQLVLSVCTGSLLLARAGLLDGLKATTHFGAMELLRELAPAAEVVEGVRFVDNGRIILSAGIAAGIDAALRAVSRLLDHDSALAAARRMEYRWEVETGGDDPRGPT